MRTQNKSQGFTLLEVLVVLALLIPIMLIAMRLLTTQSQTSSINTLITTEAQELVMLENAATQYAPTIDSTWTVNTLQTVGIPAMVTAALLPQSFANRNGAVGTSPLFQTYQVTAQLLTAGGTPQILVSLAGNPTPARLARFGLTQSAPDLQSFNQRVAQQVQALNANVYAGVIGGGTQIVTGNYGAFNENVATLYTTAPTYPTAAVLYGFADLGPINPPGGSASKYKACQLSQSQASVWYVQYNQTPTPAPACAAGWTDVADFPYCGEWPNAKPVYLLYGTPVGDISFGETDTTSTGQYQVAIACPPNTTGCTNGWYQGYQFGTTTTYSTQIMLNGAKIGSDGVCWEDVAEQGYSTTFGGWCYPSVSSGYVPCIVGGSVYGAYSSGLGNTNKFVDRLCCLPN